MKKYLLFLMALFVSVMSYAQGSGTQDDPAVLSESQTFTMPGSGSWSHYYFTYSCGLTGTLKFSGGSMFDVGVDAEASYDNAYGHYDSTEYKYVQKIDVTEGTTYILDLYMYVGDNVTITLPYVVKDGDFEQPFDISSASVDMGSDARTVWAVFTPTIAGEATVSGANGIVTGIKVFDSKYNANYYLTYGYDTTSASAEGNTVSFAAKANQTYYIAATKVSSPMGNTLSGSVREYEEGEVCSKPIDATASPYTATVAAGASVWYKVATLAAGSYKKLSVVTDENASLVYGYNYYSYGTTQYYSQLGSYTGSNEFSIGTNYNDGDHVICVTNNGTSEISVQFTVSDYTPGEVATNPIELELGKTYTINGDGDRYYSYTFTGGETIAFELGEGLSVSPNSYFYGIAAVDGNKFLYNYDYSSTFVFVVKGGKDGDTFNFVEGQLPVGSTQSNPLIVDGTYTFDANTTEIWVQYTATEDGSLKVSCNVPYDWNNTIRYFLNDNYQGYLDNNNVYNRIIDVVAGDKVLVGAKLNAASEGCQIKFEPYVPEEGESAKYAIMLYNGDEFVVPAGTVKYYKFEATKTDYSAITLTTTNSSINVTKWDSEAEALGNYGSYTVSFYENTSTPYTKEGMNYLMVNNYQTEDVTMTISGNLTTFHEHSYSTEWTYNDNGHWHACTAVENCNEISDYAAHEFGADRKCICGYVKPYSVTVGDGTATNGYFPIYGYYADAQGVASSTVYNESLLEELKGKKITSLKYELSEATTALSATFQFYIGQTEATAIHEIPEDKGTLIYEGPVTFDGTSMTIPLSEPYEYNGGNLVITSYVAVAGNWVTTSWVGENVDDLISYCSSGANASFLPKTSFMYQAAASADPVLQQTYPQTNTKVTEIPDNIIFMFDQEITSVDAAAIQWGENEPVMIDAEKISIQDGNSVYLNVADIKAQVEAGQVTVFVQLTGVENPYEANFELGAEFTVDSYELTATGGTIKFTSNVDFVDYATEGTATVLDAEGAEVTTATLTLSDEAWDVINVEFATELANGEYVLDVPAATIMSTTTEEYAGGKLPFTVGGSSEPATFVSVTPVEGSTVDLETEYVVKFSAPVKYTVYMSDISVGLNPFSDGDGAFFSMSEDKTEIHAKLDTESIADWYGVSTIEEYVSKFGSTVTLHLWKVKDEATGEELEYNDPDDDPQFTFSFKLGDPVLSIEPANGAKVEQLDVVYFSCAEGLEMTGGNNEILVMRNKEQIASIPASELVAVEAGWFDGDDDDDIFGGSAVTTYYYEFEEPFTEVGTYEVYVPAGTFTLAGANENPVVISTFEIAGEPAGLAADPAAGVVESLSTITLTYNGDECCTPSYQDGCDITLTDADGNVIATFDQEYLNEHIIIDESDWWADPTGVTLTIDEPITAPGTYTLNIPYQTFYVGNYYENSPATTFVYTIEAPAETWTKTGYVMPIESWGTDIFWTDACAQEVTVTGTVGSNVIEISQDSYGYHNVITVTANEEDGVDAILYNGEAQPSWQYFDFGSSYSQYLSLGYCYANADPEYGYVTLYGWFDDGDPKYVDIEWFEGAKEYAEAWKAITGIKNVNADSDSEATYNLAGQRVKASTKGILIKNGKKYYNK